MKRLTLTYRGEAIVSGAFDFRAYRLMHRRFFGAEGLSQVNLDSAAMEAVVSMFDGTALTEDILLGDLEIDPHELMRVCEKALEWYLAVKITPREPRVIGKPPDDPIMSIYRNMLLNRGILPGDIDKQDPQLVFDVMSAEDDEAVAAGQLPPELQMFYGL